MIAIGYMVTIAIIQVTVLVLLAIIGEIFAVFANLFIVKAIIVLGAALVFVLLRARRRGDIDLFGIDMVTP